MLTREGYAKKTEIPAAVDLTGYAKLTDIPSLAGYAKLTDIPSLSGYARQDWVEAKGYLTAVAWGDVTSKPTTLSGYGITDAKISGGVITLGTNSITPIVAADLKALTFQSGAFSAKTYSPTSAQTVNVPTHTSHLTNNSDFTTNALLTAGLATKADRTSFEELKAWMEDMFELQTDADSPKGKRIRARYGLYSDYFVSARGDNPWQNTGDFGINESQLAQYLATHDYAKKSDIPAAVDLTGYAKLSDIPSLAGYAKLTDIPSLTGYAKLTDIPSLAGYAKQDWVEAKGYLVAADMKSLTFQGGVFSAKTYSPATAQTVNVPTHTSHLTNNSDFTTNALLTAGLATKADRTSFEELKAWMEDMFELQTDAGSPKGKRIRARYGLYSDYYVSARGDNPWQGQGNVGLDETQLAQYLATHDYAKKNDIPAAVDLTGYAKLSDIPSLTGYAKLTDIPSLAGYAKQDWVEAKGYLVAADMKSLTFQGGVFTAKTYSPATAQTVNVPTHTSHLTNNSDFTTNALLNAGLATKADRTSFEELKAWMEDMFELQTDAGSPEGKRIRARYGLYSDYFISARGVNPWQGQGNAGLDETQLAQYLTTHNYAKKSDIPSLTDYAKKSDIPSLAGYATQTWVEGKGYATLTYVNTELNKKLNAADFNTFVAKFNSMFVLEDDSTLTKKKKIKALFGLYTDDFLSARGINPNGTGGGSSWGLMKKWTDYTSDIADTDALSAGLGWDLYQRFQNYLTKTDAQTLYQPKGNYLTSHQSLANYVTLDGAQTITGGKTFNANTSLGAGKALVIPLSTKVTNGGALSYIHGGADGANSEDANLRFGSWYGIGWYPTIDNQTVPQGENAMWLNVRTGDLTVRGKFIKSGGTSSQFLKADGSVDSNTYLTTSSASSTYLPKSSYTASDVLAKLLTVDGAGSGLDADMLDGVNGISYLAEARGLGHTTRNTMTWINGEINPDTMGGLTRATGVFVSFAGYASGHKAQMLLSKDYLKMRCCYGDTDNSDWKDVAFLDSNVASATKLADNTARTAWGQTFFTNGQPQSISGNMTGVGNITTGAGEHFFDFAHTDGITHGYIARWTNRFAIVSTNAIWLSVHTNVEGKTFNPAVAINSDNNVGIGTSTPAYKLDVNGIIRSNNEVISTNSNAFRAAYGNYGFLIRNDGSSTYFLLTASGDQYGTWNNLRPLAINDSTGLVTMNNGLNVNRITIGSCVITYEDGGLKFSEGIYSEKYVSARGLNGQSGGGSSWGLMKKWTDYTSGIADTDALSAGLGWDLYQRFQSYLTKTDAQTLYQPKGNYLTSHQSLANYVTLDGAQTITGGKTFNANTSLGAGKALVIPLSTKVTNGGALSYIHGGADGANSEDANLRFGSWYGIGWYPTIVNQTVPQGENAMWLNVRTGDLTVRGKFIKDGGTSSQFLKADGSVDSNTYLTTGSASSTYVKKSGDTMTGALILGDGMNNGVRFVYTDGKGYLQLGNPSSHEGAITSLFGASLSTLDILCANNALTTNGNKLWHAGNDGAGSGLDADLLDGYHAGSFEGQIPVWRNLGHYSAVNNNDTNDSSNMKNFLRRITGSSPYGAKLGGWAFIGTLIPNSQCTVIGKAYDDVAYKDGMPRYSYFIKQNLDGRIQAFGTFNGDYYEKKVAFTSDNVDSATKLADHTARTAWGQPFFTNGQPQSISGNLSEVGSIDGANGMYSIGTNYTDGWSDGANNHPWYGLDHRYGNTGIYSTVLSDYYGMCFHTYKCLMCLTSGGNVGIGTTAPAYKLDVNGVIKGNNEIIAASGNAFRAAYGNYGFLIRNDGSSTYFLLTASGDQYGTWNNLRPLAINDSTGLVTMNNGLNVNRITIGSCVITYEDGGLKFSEGIYSEKYVSARGLNGQSGGGSSWGLMKKWTEYSSGIADTDALSAGLGWDLYQNKLDKSKSAIESLLTGNVTTHSHSQYLTSSALSGYLPTAVADATYVTLNTAQTISGAKTFSSDINFTFVQDSTDTNTFKKGESYGLIWGGSSDTCRLYWNCPTGNNGVLHIDHHDDGDEYTSFEWKGVMAYKFAKTALTAPSFIKSGGTSSQFLKADGSVDSNTYLTTSTASSTYLTKTSASSTYLPKTGGTISGALTVNAGLSIGADYEINALSNGLEIYNDNSGISLYLNDDGTLMYGEATVIRSNNIGSYNAGSATKLLNTRTIWGQDFNGEENVTGNLTLGSGCSIIGGNSVEILKDHGNNNVTVNASTGDLYLGYWRTSAIRFYSGNSTGTGTEKMILLANGNIGLGTSSPAYKLDVSGDIYSSATVRCSILRTSTGLELYGPTPYIDFHYNNSNADYDVRLINQESGVLRCVGTFRATVGMWSDGYVSGRGQNTSSDSRLKERLTPFEMKLQDVAFAPSVGFCWKDNGQPDLGTIAQYWKGINQILTPEDPDGYLTLQYGKTALLACISVAKRVVNHEERIEALERENRELKRKIEILERR